MPEATPAALPAGQFAPGTGVRVFDSDYKNPHIYSFNVGYEQELAADLSGYADFTWNEGRDLTRFLNYNRSGPVCCTTDGTVIVAGTGNAYAYPGPMDTELMRDCAEASGDAAHYYAAFARHAPLGLMARPEEVAELILLLFGPATGFITGTAIPIDGGSTAGRL